MMRLALVITFIVLWATPMMAQEELTLEKAIETALENNYSIKIARNNEEIAQNNHTLGNAGFLPTVTANYNRDYGVQSFEQQRATGDVSDSGAKSQRETYGATLNWTIFDGLKMFTTYDQLEALNKQSEDQTRAQIELLVYNVTAAFYSAALEKERLLLFESNVGLSEERLKVSKDKYELGKASKIEFLQAQVDLNADKSSMIKQLELLAVRKFELMQLMAIDQDSLNFIINYEIENDPDIALSELLDRLESQNAQLLALKRDQVIALNDKKIVEGDRLPEVGLFADYTHSSFETPAGFVLSGNSDDITYGVTARWTLFDGFNVNRRLSNAKIQYETAQYQYKDQLLAFTTDIKTRYINYRNNLDLLKLEKENLSVAKENNEIAQERYQIGLSNALELRESQINLINAEIRYQNAAFAAKQAEIELKYLSGTLLMK
ncbi:TolC family protein [Fulvivirga kasyanovii]|uniref:TolC family protein n=1 Tax=Fulvivirga kasyanovii TaxID=396812 RepID=A0ABW9RXT6_9BACT|nr:TolC family protein [Fulvivirga kasyanovii]MTI28008.1 TolC family protein [Fulvivirga kasyanovii]